MAVRIPLAQTKVRKSMEEMAAGTLHSGGPSGPRVDNPKQAIAIGLSEARARGARVPPPPRTRRAL